MTGWTLPLMAWTDSVWSKITLPVPSVTFAVSLTGVSRGVWPTTAIASLIAPLEILTGSRNCTKGAVRRR